MLSSFPTLDRESLVRISFSYFLSFGLHRCIPTGAPVSSDWNPGVGLERHVPVLFLDLNPDDLSAPRQANLNGSFESSSYLDGMNEDGLMVDLMPQAGGNSILPKEHGGQFFSLPLVKFLDSEEIGAVASWDSSIHDSPYLNRVTEGNERVYLILKATVRLSHPSPLDLVLRKRLGINIYKKQSFTSLLKKTISRGNGVTQTGVMYLRLERMEAPTGAAVVVARWIPLLHDQTT